jgi:uncharacterized coiled-coil DUF342 family protein
MEMLNRFQARLLFEIQEERKEPCHQVPIAETELREELDNLKRFVYDMKAELDELRKDNNLLREELHSFRNDSMQIHQSHIIKLVNDQEKVSDKAMIPK